MSSDFDADWHPAATLKAHQNASGQDGMTRLIALPRRAERVAQMLRSVPTPIVRTRTNVTR
jgi:hypothetical protein